MTNILTDGNENEFKTKERKVFEIYSFRILLQYLKNKYDAFKNFLKDKKYLNYKNAFKDKDSLDDQTPKIIEFCGITIEDFLNTKKDEIRLNCNTQNAAWSLSGGIDSLLYNSPLSNPSFFK